MTARPFRDVANLYLLTNCDMECSFCYASKNLGAMSFERAAQVIDFFVGAGADRINLTGGEALMHPDALQIVAYAAEAGLLVTLFTSGSMLTARRASRFLRHLDWLALSLDGPPEINVAMGRSERHYPATVEALRLTRQLKPELKIRVATVVTRINMAHLHELGELYRDRSLAPSLWRLKQMVPTRRARDQQDRLAVSDDEFKRQMTALVDKYEQYVRIQVHPAASKVADTMCIHPNGSATVTLGDGADMDIVGLGNVFTDPGLVLERWWRHRDDDNARAYDAMWEFDSWA